jgi:hypothetical protein
MAWTIAAIDPMSGSRELLVEVHPEVEEVSDATLHAFAERLFRRNVRVGLVMTPAQTVVLRDTLSSMQFADNKYARARLATEVLMRHARLGAPRGGEHFLSQALTWLEAIGSSWYTFLHESAVSAMVPDVVGNLAGATLETWDGLLESHDAAE